LSSGTLSDAAPAIPLLKKIENLKLSNTRYQTMDAGSDHEPIYKQVHRTGPQCVNAHTKRNEPEPVAFDRHFAPAWCRENTHRYDSHDSKFETLKYARPKECIDCPLATQDICQKAFKMKITKDLRKYTAPARGSKAWQSIYNRRTAVERVNAYLKEFFQLN